MRDFAVIALISLVLLAIATVGSRALEPAWGTFLFVLGFTAGVAATMNFKKR